MAETIQSLNRLINCVDPGKDAAQGSILNNKVHGAFLKDSVYKPLFKLDKLSSAEVVQGVGDKKEFIHKKVDSAFRLIDFPKREITRLRYSGSGNAAPRLEGYNLAYDAGSGLEELSSQYRPVLTPASILDRASRDKNPPNAITLLNKPSEFLPELIEDLDLDGCLVSVLYEGLKNGKYNFTFKTTIPGYETFTAEYKDNKKLEPITFEADYCANIKKNEYISEHWKNPAELSKIKALVLMKELGDTLQVAWLKQAIQQQPLQADKTAICTSDTVVWLRAIINSVSCVFSVKGGTSTLYPVALNDEQKQVAITIIKNQDLDLLKWINQKSIDTVRECIRRSTAANFQFADSPGMITLETRRAITRILKSIEARLVREAADIIKRLEPLFGSELQEYRRTLDSFALEDAFILGKGNSIRWQKTFKAFLPKQKVFPKIEVNLSLLQILAKQKVPDAKTVKLILRGIPLVSEGGRPAGGGGGGSPRPPADYEPILKTNLEIPGFLAFFIMTYFPELFYIAFSYDLAASKQLEETKKIYESVFQYKISTEAFSEYGDFDGARLEYIPGEVATLNKLDEIAKRACSILRAARDYSRGAEELTLFEGAGKEIGWILDKSGGATIPPGNTDLHWDAFCYYEQLFRAEYSLCLLAKRDTESPLDSVELIESFSTPLAVGTPTVIATPPKAISPRFTIGVTRPKQKNTIHKHKLKGVSSRKERLSARARAARARRGFSSTRRASVEVFDE